MSGKALREILVTNNQPVPPTTGRNKKPLEDAVIAYFAQNQINNEGQNDPNNGNSQQGSNNNQSQNTNFQSADTSISGSDGNSLLN